MAEHPTSKSTGGFNQPDVSPYNFDVCTEKTWRSKCAGKGAALEARCPQLRMVWITCEGATPHDTEYMGPLSYTPTTGVRGFYFPYLNQQLYLK